MFHAWLVLIGEATAAFLTLDMFFRYISVDPGLLRRRVRQYALVYLGVATLGCAVGAMVQWRAAGYGGLPVAALNWAPWWLLWRFGLRKQFTYLFKSDGGRPVDTQKPDP